MFSINVKLGNRLIDDIKQENSDLKQAIKRGMIEVGSNIQAQAIKNTSVGVYDIPKDIRPSSLKYIKKGRVGGHLRRSWSLSPINENNNNLTISVYNPVEYAEYYEYGHKQNIGQYVPILNRKLVAPYVKGQYPLTKAIKLYENEIENILYKYVKGIE